MISYEDFVSSKERHVRPCGFDAVDVNDALKGFQSDLVRWSCRLGRAAIFADCGLGKTPMQLEWARQVCAKSGGKVLILAPLAVSSQTVREGAKFGIPVAYAKNQAEVSGPITVTNYERLESFDCAAFDGIVLDESSILKSYDGKTRTTIIESFSRTPYRLACTATPAPNDHMELGNHAEFLGVMSRTEMLATYFCHDGDETQTWRLKGHAEDAFWRWVCSWAVTIRRPSDLGYSDDGYVLPPMQMHEHVVKSDAKTARMAGMLFAMEARTLSDQRAARRASLDHRIECAAKLANNSRDPWVLWCELNAESEALTAAIPGAVNVQGSDSADDKEKALADFSSGKIRVLVTKPSIAGFGMNWQHCANVAFVGASHSFEQTYQAVRRCWRFGQTRDVAAHFISSDTDGAIVGNLRRKEKDAAIMAESMLGHMRDIQRAEVQKTSRQTLTYAPSLRLTIPSWLATEQDGQ